MVLPLRELANDARVFGDLLWASREAVTCGGHELTLVVRAINEKDVSVFDDEVPYLRSPMTI